MGGDVMVVLIVAVALLAVAVVGSRFGVDSRPLDPSDNAPQWPFAPYRS